MKSIHKIVITGGPCAGKSTAMSWIQNAFTERGYQVLFVPETATELISGGVAPWTCGSNMDYQRCQVRLQMEKETIFAEAAQSMGSEKILIVCDRGILDNRAYMTDEEFSCIAGENGSSEVEMRDGYDAVFHLVTAAKGAEQFYTTANNRARTETAEEAVTLDDKLIAAWTGHPHLRIIDNATDFEEKMKRLISEIASFLGEPEPYEVERKFLIEYPDIKMLESLPNCQRVEIIQTYLNSPGGDEIRVRQRGERGHYSYYKTVKRSISPMKRLELESRLTQREYLELLMDADTSCRQIRKTRYCLTYHSQYFEIDVFPFWEDKAVAEIELTEEAQEIEFPYMLRVIREVTDDETYKNAVLASKTEDELCEYECYPKRNVFAIGRWMPLHKGHKAFLTKLAGEFDMLVIGIGSCYENGTARNCIPAVLREKMLRCMLQKEGIPSEMVKIVPVQDYATFEEWIEEILEVCARNRVTHFCTGNREEILNVFEERGMELPFDLIDPEKDSDFPFHATDIRRAITGGEKERLKNMVPVEILPMVEECVAREVVATEKGDGKEFVPGRQTVDMVFLLSDPVDGRNYVLVGERDSRKADFPGITALPGGGILRFESPVDAVARVFELETGIDMVILDNAGEPAKVSIRQFSDRGEELYFVGIYASPDERVNGTRGGGSQCFGTCVRVGVHEAEKYLNSRHDLDNLRFVPVEEVLDMQLAFEQSEMLRDAVQKLFGELLDVVDEDGVPTGDIVSRERAHTEGILHGASHVFLYRMKEDRLQLLLQRRSDGKDSYPGCLDISAAGHMEHGMGYRETARKELREELGVVVPPGELKECFSQLHCSDNDFHGARFINREFNQVYIMELNVDISELELQVEEVSEAVWMDVEEVRNRLRRETGELCLDAGEFEKVIKCIKDIG